MIACNAHNTHSTPKLEATSSMSSIYRSSPSKRSKPVGGAPGTGGGGSGGGGGGGGGGWTVVGGEPQQGNPLWPCPTKKDCRGLILSKTRKNSSSTYGVCDTRRSDDPDTCQVFYNINKRHWGSGENPRVCVFCEGDTGGSPSIGVQQEQEDGTSSSKSCSVQMVFGVVVPVLR